MTTTVRAMRRGPPAARGPETGEVPPERERVPHRGSVILSVTPVTFASGHTLALRVLWDPRGDAVGAAGIGLPGERIRWWSRGAPASRVAELLGLEADPHPGCVRWRWSGGSRIRVALDGPGLEWEMRLRSSRLTCILDAGPGLEVHVVGATRALLAGRDLGGAIASPAVRAALAVNAPGMAVTAPASDYMPVHPSVVSSRRSSATGLPASETT